MKHHLPNDGSARRALGLFVLLIGVLVTVDANALNYERNDLRARELSLAIMRTPDTGLPLSIAVRGSARRHIRHVYYGTSALLGWSSANRPVTMLSVAIGLESAATAFQRMRGYGELGAGAFWGATESPLKDLMTFHAEGGIRWNIRDWSRPHWQIVFGVRVFANFENIGWAAITGMNFNFE